IRVGSNPVPDCLYVDTLRQSHLATPKLEENRKLGSLAAFSTLDVRCGVLDEAIRQCCSPIDSGAAFLLAPGDRLPIRRHYQETARINLHAIAAGFVRIEI